MSPFRLGFAAHHRETAWTDSTIRAAALDLAANGGWFGELRYLSLLSTPGERIPRSPGMVPAKRMREELDTWLQDPVVATVTLATARDTRDDSERLWFERLAWGPALPLTHGVRASTDASDAWLARVLGYFDASGSTAGVIVAMADRREAISECSSGTISPNGRLAHPWPEQVMRMKGENASHLGTRYMRFPRWGTLVSHAHVAALGGLDALVAAIRPARTQSLSGGVFIQLTESPTTAMGDEALAKQRAFIELAAPLLPPPR